MTPDLDALRAIAEAAAKARGWRGWYTPMSFPVTPPAAAHIATFDPPTVVALIDRIRQLEAERAA